MSSGTEIVFEPMKSYFSNLNFLLLLPSIVFDNKISQSINKATEMFNWEKLFQNKSIHDQFKLFNEIIVNIVSNYISNKFITCNGKDPPWLIDHIKCLINLKNKIFKNYLKDIRPDSVYENLPTISWDLTEAEGSSKNVYYERLTSMLNDPNTSAKSMLVDNQNPFQRQKSSSYTPNTS